jgi:ubiquinone/menaquinone biosynthesis C-methylase UbiE
MKLNLCSGGKPFPDFTNVDFCEPADVVHDLTKPLPFEDDSAEKIVCIHGIEHFYRYDVDGIVKDWVRVLKPGGVLIIECPCLDKVLEIFDHHIRAKTNIDMRMTMWALYGDPRYNEPGMVHRWCYSKWEMRAMLENFGLEVVETEPKFHVPTRDMRFEGRKPWTK